jgi:hypothetical protein
MHLTEFFQFAPRCYARLHPRAVNCRKKKCGHSNQVNTGFLELNSFFLGIITEVLILWICNYVDSSDGVGSNVSCHVPKSMAFYLYPMMLEDI